MSTESGATAPGAWRVRAAVLVGGGMVTTLNIGKLPPALPVLQEHFALSLVQVSWMVSLFMLGSSLFGIVGGSIADRFEPRRVMASGLLLLATAGALGALAHDTATLFVSRALESLGFLLAVLPAPSLLQRLVPPASLRGWLSVWSSYMPFGMGIGLIISPMLMEIVGWRGLWGVCAVLSALWAVAISLTQPRRVAHSTATTPLGARAIETITAPGPWLLATCFLFYAGQFMAIFSFLPSIYREHGVSAQLGASLTALAVIVNASGNLAAGMLIQRGADRAILIALTGLTMAIGAWFAFGADIDFTWRYVAILVLSAVGGLIPGSLFATVTFYAPSPATVSTTVGLMQQGSGLGQLLLPPLVAALAQYSGGWESIWVAIGLAAMTTVLIAFLIHRHDRLRPQ